jgi:long-chain fatty acid transport protein
VANADWEEWSAFSENVITLTIGPNNRPVPAILDRDWDDTFKVGFGGLGVFGKNRIGLGAAYDSSVVEDQNRTIDLPMDEQLRVSGSWGRVYGDGAKSKGFAISATLADFGSAPVGQTSQGVSFAGDFDKNWILFLGATFGYRF